MKRIFFIVFMTLIISSVSAQWNFNGTNIYNSNTGNVGINISNPQYPFSVWDGGTNVYTGFGFLPGSGPDEYAELRCLKATSVGLMIKALNQDNGRGQAVIHFKTANGSQNSQITMMGNFVDIRTGINYNDFINSNTFGSTALFINNNQQVGIGTQSPGSFRLAVEGKIGAREIKVTLANPWPDYVFHQQYQLMSLLRLEKYINQHKHLPGIPTANEVKENEGIDLGTMNVKLLEKIEELTLYVIELKKEIEKLKERE